MTPETMIPSSVIIQRGFHQEGFEALCAYDRLSSLGSQPRILFSKNFLMFMVSTQGQVWRILCELV